MHTLYRPHARVQVTDFGPSMAKQDLKDECDINILMKKYEKTGMIDHIIRYKGQYADVSAALDYQEAIHTVMAAEAMFDSLPAAIRDRFHNSPREFLEFTEDENNRDEMLTLGLLAEPPADPSEDTKQPSSNPSAPSENATPE